MKVSIIIPVYNVEKYIQRCVQSVINQTYRDIEIILVDDGSTDRSGNICDQLKKTDERIVVFHQSNKGVSSARNVGLDNANGDGILFIDGDDYVTPDHVQVLVSMIENSKTDMAVTSYLRVNSFYHGRTEAADSEIIQTEIFPAEQATVMMLLSKKIDSCICCKLIRKEYINNISFLEGQTIAEDLLFYYELLKIMRNISYCDHKGYYYVQHESGTINNFNSSNMTSLNIFERLINGEENIKISTALKSKFVSTCFHFLSLASDDNESRVLLENIIKKYRLEMLTKRNVALKVRVACLISYFSFKLVKKLTK